jgi:ribosomal protein L32E
VLFIYDNLHNAFSEKSKEMFRQQQFASYEKQMEAMRQSEQNTAKARHDTVNHIISVKELYSQNKETVKKSL